MTSDWSPSDSLRQLCDEQREKWQRGECAFVESFLDRHAELKTNESLLLDFILAEYTLREELRDRPTPTEYFQRFPHLTPQLERLFELNEAINARTEDIPQIAEAVGTVIGPYRLLQKIGEGGFGIVFMAEQTAPVRRMVALKVIKPGMDCAQVIARFESERQALALMDHPNVAKVLDAGATKSGHPYFVMELVRGAPITEFCDKNHFSPEMRLKLFVDVCHAIQHAHHKGIIHRDIKPSNVMVTLRDGVPAVKVIDFGVAKATSQRLTERTLFTAYGQMVGTPAYMSPEQAEMSELDIDTRTDVYSLGVLLYELLTGTTPLEVDRSCAAGYAEMQRMIREEEAPRPSTRLSSLRGAATIVAGNRGLEVKRLVQVLSGDLDWVVMKALEKDRNRRYDTPGSFAEDVDRYLHREAIQARPPSRVYRFSKFVQRNRGAVLTAGFIAGALLVGAVVAIWQAVRATRAETAAVASAAGERKAKNEALVAAKSEGKAKNDALAREAETKAVLGFVEDKIIAAARPEMESGGLGRSVSLPKAIELALPYVDQSFPNQPLIEARLRLTLGRSFFFLGNARTAAEQEAAARAIFARYRGPDHPDTLASMNDLASSLDALGQLSEALKLREETLALRRATLGPDHPDTLTSMNNLATSYVGLGRYSDAIRLRQETLTLRRARLGPDHRDTLKSMNNLANMYFSLSRLNDALALYEETLALRRAKFAPGHPDTIVSMNNLALAYRALGRYVEALRLNEEALTLLRAKLGPDHADTLASMNNLAGCYYSLGRYADAIKLYEQALALQKAHLGSDHPDTLTTMNGLANTFLFVRRYSDAAKLYDETLALKKAKFGPVHPDTLTGMSNLALAYSALGRHADALKLYEQALPLEKVKLGADHKITLEVMGNLANTYSALGRHAEALKLYEQALAAQKGKLGPDDPDTLATMHDLADYYVHIGRDNDAFKLREQVLAGRKTKLGRDHPDTLRTMAALAESLVAVHRSAEALQVIDECLQRADGKEVDPNLVPGLIELRLRLFESNKDAAGCRRTAEMWEALHRTDAAGFYRAARLRAVTAGVLRAANKSADASQHADAEANHAIDWLKQAVAAGCKDTQHIRTDKDLEPLRSREDFLKIGADLQRANAAEK